MGNRRIIDPHMHIWDVSKHEYPWLDTANESLPKHYLLKDYLAESEKFTITKAVHIQAGIARHHSVEETAWLVREAQSLDFPLAIVGYVDLSQVNCEPLIEAHARYPGFTGIRQILTGDNDLMEEPLWQKNLSMLSKHQLVFDMQIFPEQVRSACNVISKNENLFIIEHGCQPRHLDHETYVFWKTQLTSLAQFDHVYLKLSGFDLFHPGFTDHEIKPFVHAAVDIFGVDRCMFASNFPVDKPYRGFDNLYHGYLRLTEGLSEDEKNLLFYENADRVYFDSRSRKQG